MAQVLNQRRREYDALVSLPGKVIQTVNRRSVMAIVKG
jgi:hypothetical protein